MNHTKNFSVEGMSFHQLTSTGVSGRYDPYFCIPAYQRQYTWEAPQVMQLLGDVYDYFWEACEAEGKEGQQEKGSERAFAEKFIGAFILVEKETAKPQANTVYDVIDGQQRITTLSLAIAAGVRVLLEITNEIARLAEQNPEMKQQVDRVNPRIASQINEIIKMLCIASLGDKYAPKLFRESDDVHESGDVQEYLPKTSEIPRTNDAEVDVYYTSPTAKFFFYLAKARRILWSPWEVKPEGYQRALDAVQTGEMFLTACDKKGQQTCYWRNYDLAREFLRQVRLGMRHDGNAEELPFNKDLGDENQYDPKPLPDKVEHCVASDSMLCSLVRDLWDILSSDSKLKELSSAALYVLSYLDFLSNKVSIAVISGNNDTALDLFETMNTAGQPLGCIETFIPEVYQTVAKLEKLLPEAEKGSLLKRKRTFGVIRERSVEEVVREIQDIFGISKNRSGVPQVVIWFALICFGTKVGKNFQIQRSELKKNFKAFIGSDQKARPSTPEATWEKVHEFMSLLLFVGKWWELCYGSVPVQDVPVPSRFEGDWIFENGFIPEELSEQVDRSELDVLNFCLAFLIRAGQSLSVAILGRFYIQLLKDPSPDNLRELIKAAKAVSAFTAIWLSGAVGSTQYAETQRRTMVHEIDNKNITQTPGKLAYFWMTGVSGENVRAQQLQESFISGYCARHNAFALNEWLERLPNSELASQRKEVNRFLLLLYWHCSNSKRCNRNVGIRRYADKPEIYFLTGESWNALSKLEVEHIVPQQPKAKDWGLNFDPKSLQGKLTLNEVGNTTLLPKRLNVFAGNRPWAYKSRLYAVLCASNPEERAKIYDSLDGIPKKERKTIESQLKTLHKEFRSVDTVLVDSIRHIDKWTSSLIKTRTKAIAHIVWPLLSDWLGKPAKFDKKAVDALFAEFVSKMNEAGDDAPQRDVHESLRPFLKVIPLSAWRQNGSTQLTIDNEGGGYLDVRVEDGKLIVEMGDREVQLRRSRDPLPESVEFETISGEKLGCPNKVLVYAGKGPEAEMYLVSLVKNKKKRFVENQKRRS